MPPPGEDSAACVPVFGSTFLCTAYEDLEVLVLIVNSTIREIFRGVFVPRCAFYRHIESRDRGEGFLPPPRLPLPQGRYPPRSRVWGVPEEKSGAWVSSPGCGFPWVSPRLPPRPLVGEEARRAGRGGGCWHIERRGRPCRIRLFLSLCAISGVPSRQNL